MLIPIANATFLGVIAVGSSVWRLVGLAWVYRQMRRAHAANHDLEISDWLLGIAIPFCAYGVLGAAGAGFISGRREAFICLAFVTIALLGVGVWSAWELVIWLADVTVTRADGENRPE
jgi:hypothetical protein